MGNIERDERAWRLSAGGPFNRAGQRQTLVYGSQLREGEEVEVVPSSQLRGAVEALEAVSAVIPAYWGKTGSNAQRRAYELLTAVLYPDATGGQ